MAWLTSEQIWDIVNAKLGPKASWEVKYAEYKLLYAAQQHAMHDAAKDAFEDKQMAALYRIEALMRLKWGLAVPGGEIPEPPESKE